MALERNQIEDLNMRPSDQANNPKLFNNNDYQAYFRQDTLVKPSVFSGDGSLSFDSPYQSYESQSTVAFTRSAARDNYAGGTDYRSNNSSWQHGQGDSQNMDPSFDDFNRDRRGKNSEGTRNKDIISKSEMENGLERQYFNDDPVNKDQFLSVANKFGLQNDGSAKAFDSLAKQEQDENPGYISADTAAKNITERTFSTYNTDGKKGLSRQEFQNATDHQVETPKPGDQVDPRDQLLQQLKAEIGRLEDEMKQLIDRLNKGGLPQLPPSDNPSTPVPPVGKTPTPVDTPVTPPPTDTPHPPVDTPVTPPPTDTPPPPVDTPVTPPPTDTPPPPVDTPVTPPPTDTPPPPVDTPVTPPPTDTPPPPVDTPVTPPPTDTPPPPVDTPATPPPTDTPATGDNPPPISSLPPLGGDTPPVDTPAPPPPTDTPPVDTPPPADNPPPPVDNPVTPPPADNPPPPTDTPPPPADNPSNPWEGYSFPPGMQPPGTPGDLPVGPPDAPFSIPGVPGNPFGEDPNPVFAAPPAGFGNGNPFPDAGKGTVIKPGDVPIRSSSDIVKEIELQGNSPQDPRENHTKTSAPMPELWVKMSNGTYMSAQQIEDQNPFDGKSIYSKNADGSLKVDLSMSMDPYAAYQHPITNTNDLYYRGTDGNLHQLKPSAINYKDQSEPGHPPGGWYDLSFDVPKDMAFVRQEWSDGNNASGIAYRAPKLLEKVLVNGKIISHREAAEQGLLYGPGWNG